MAQTCSRCSRLNPAEAFFCHFDGHALAPAGRNGGPPVARTQRFPTQFVFPSGRTCGSFDELAIGCQQNWPEARDVLRQGYLENFLSGLGRADLARAAREAARFPDPDRGLDQFLARLPSGVLAAPKLHVEPQEINLGHLRVGEDRRFELELENQGMRLLYGTVTCEEGDWLAVGEGRGAAVKLFEFAGEMTVSVLVRGERLRAGNKLLQARLVIDSNGGMVMVTVTAEVPVKPFPEGVLAGAKSPRQIAERAKASPKEAAVFLENGAVARWYRENGWIYPIPDPPGIGLGAVQQFFEALGLTPPPKVEISERAICLAGVPGQALHHALEVRAREPRPVWAHAVSDRPWLEVGRVRLQGRSATIPLAVPAVPDHNGETLQARLTITSNGNQRFTVPVSLTVGKAAAATPTRPAAEDTAWGAPLAAPPGPSVPAATVTRSRPDQPAAALAVGTRRRWRSLVPGALLALALLGLWARDFLVADRAAPPAPAGEADVVVRFHDGPKGDELDRLVPGPTMRFGLSMAADPASGGTPKRLTFDEWGRTNNTCLKLDGAEHLFGDASGRWVEREAHDWTDEQGRAHHGTRSVQAWDGGVQVTQTVELVPGEQSGRLDTCLVRYRIENQGPAPHEVGIRFLLDTYIGANDGVPFNIPGEPELCGDQKDFTGNVPDFIEAYENEDLANPGTVAHLKLRLGDREPPGRVTLGAWPDDNLQRLLGRSGADGVHTRWDVPVLPMKTLFPYDSAVAIYWDPRPLAPGEKREVGFAYGLGRVASSDKLLVTTDGSFKPGGELTVTVVVADPTPGEAVTLTVPEGFTIQGDARQPVPEAGTGPAGRKRPVTWHVRAGPIGVHRLVVTSGNGDSQSQTVTIKASSIFD